MIYYIQITFDTEGIKKQYPNPSQDSELPTEIEESYCYMVASSALLTGSVSRRLELYQNEEFEKIRLYGASASNNFEDSVLIYSVTAETNGIMPMPYEPVSLTNSCIKPSIPDTLPAQVVQDEQFLFLESDAGFTGKKLHEISFALYGRDNMGRPIVYGYFKYAAIFHMHRD